MASSVPQRRAAAPQRRATTMVYNNDVSLKANDKKFPRHEFEDTAVVVTRQGGLAVVLELLSERAATGERVVLLNEGNAQFPSTGKPFAEANSESFLIAKTTLHGQLQWLEGTGKFYPVSSDLGRAVTNKVWLKQALTTQKRVSFPRPFSVVTFPGVYFTDAVAVAVAVDEEDTATDADAVAQLERAINALLGTCVLRNYVHLVLRDWGCPVVPPTVVAQAFRRALTSAQFARRFASVTFAITRPSAASAFAKEFQTLVVGKKETETQTETQTATQTETQTETQTQTQTQTETQTPKKTPTAAPPKKRAAVTFSILRPGQVDYIPVGMPVKTL